MDETASSDRPAARREKQPLVTRLITLSALLKRPMTLGVRGLVLDRDDRVFLVRHTYVAGYFLPGGGVEAGETLEQALVRELREEGNISLEGAPLLHSVYLNRHASRRDHVALYVVRDFAQSAPLQPTYEIAEADFFSLSNLPATTTSATRTRIEEALKGAPASPYW